MSVSLNENGEVLLNLGCGQNRPVGWVNMDCSLNSLLQNNGLMRWVLRKGGKRVIYDQGSAKYINLNIRWLFADEQVDLVYGSHVFEHLSQSSSALFLTESWRVLKPGGVIRIVVPDLHTLAVAYVSSFENGDINAGNELLYWVNLHQESTYPSSRNLVRKIVDWWQAYPHQHKYMYDKLSLRELVEKEGFGEIEFCSYGVSRYLPRIAEVENTAEGVASIYLEGKKLAP